MCGIKISQPLNHFCRGLVVLCGATTDKNIQANCMLLCWSWGLSWIVSIRLAEESWSCAFMTQALSPLDVYLVGVGKMFPPFVCFHCHFTPLGSLLIDKGLQFCPQYPFCLFSAIGLLSQDPKSICIMCKAPQADWYACHQEHSFSSSFYFFSSKGEYICSIEKLVVVCIAHVLIQNAGLIVKLHRGLKVHYAKCKNWL